MEREIKIGNRAFVVDDPNGSLGRIEPAQRVEQQPPADTAKTREQEAAPHRARPLPNAVEPLQTIEARAMVLEAVAQGRIGPVSLFLAWLFTGLGVYTMAWGFGHSTVHPTAGLVVACLMVLGHSMFFFSALVSMLARRKGIK